MAADDFNLATNVVQYKVNGTWVEPVLPQEMDIAYQDVDYDSGRTADGVMHRNKVGMKIKLNLSYPPMSYDDARNLLTNVVGSADSFQVRFIDPVYSLSVPHEITVYVGDRSAPVYSTGLKLFQNIKFNLIEL